VQPIVDLATGEAVGFEALSRFTEPSGAPRRTDLVFADARTLGLGGRLELAAARSALALFPDLPPGTYLSVNLSPAALLDPAAFDLLGAALNDAAGRLVVEVTEHQHVSDYPTLLHVLARLRARGLRLAIDDTGSGFASLQHVALMRPEIIKLDIAFVRDVHRDPARRAVTRAMLGFAAEVGATLVAEGVETAAEHEELLRLGATVGQGYHLGRPDDPAVAFARRPPAHALASGETAVA
jgi:EAL domain-containing protein (putative c-di-GMP-specific phosphodiesterase class I)